MLQPDPIAMLVGVVLFLAVLVVLVAATAVRRRRQQAAPPKVLQANDRGGWRRFAG